MDAGLELTRHADAGAGEARSLGCKVNTVPMERAYNVSSRAVSEDGL